jgi:hypothetical protein
LLLFFCAFLSFACYHRFVDIRFVDIRFVDIRFVDIRFVDIRFVDIRFVDMWWWCVDSKPAQIDHLLLKVCDQGGSGLLCQMSGDSQNSSLGFGVCARGSEGPVCAQPLWFSLPGDYYYHIIIVVIISFFLSVYYSFGACNYYYVGCVVPSAYPREGDHRGGLRQLYQQRRASCCRVDREARLP